MYLLASSDEGYSLGQPGYTHLPEQPSSGYLLGGSTAGYFLGSDSFEYDGLDDDATPDQFSFSSEFDASPGAVVSATAVITGVDSGVTLSAVNFQLSNDGGDTWGSVVTYVPNETIVRATVTASSTFGAEASQSGSVNGVSATFTVTTRAAVTTPEAFSFDAVSGADPGATVRATAPIVGVDVGVTLTASNFELSNDDGFSWVGSTTFVPGKTLVRATVIASGASEGVEELTGSVNGVEATFTVTTRAIDTTPAAYSFSPVEDAEPGAVVTATAAISGVDPGVTLTAVTFELSNNLGASWSSSVSYIPGQTIVRATVTASATEAGVETQSGSVNGVGATFSVTTLTFDTGGVTILPPSGLVVMIDTSDQVIQSADRPLDPYDTEWVVFAWDDRIADATLISSDWIVPTDWNLVRTAQNQEFSTSGRAFQSVNAALVDVNNAAPGRYVVSNRVHLSDGRQFERSVKIKIREM